MKIRVPFGFLLCGMAALAFAIPSAFAQNNSSNGKLKIHVSPKQAYVFVDGQAIRDGSQSMELSAGSHTIDVLNYGYLPQTKHVDITAGKTADLDVTLQASGDKVSGPFGDIELKGHPRAAVLLNGNTPAYFVGHADEFDNNFLWHQWLLVKPGTYQLTATRKGKDIWSGPVTVKAGERVIVDLNHDGSMRTRTFKAGLKLGPQPRFEAGVAGAMVPIAPVTAALSADANHVACGQTTDLHWQSADAVDISISNVGNVSATGQRSVSPTAPTTYTLVAKGPGGTAEQTVTINVNAQPTATLSLSTPQVTYHKIGDKVVEQGAATLDWSTSNANQVSIQPFGTVSDTGSRNINPAPDRTATGPINRDVTYTMNVSNACGGTATRTATLHIVGSIDPAPAITLASVFYPTAYPERTHPKTGLVSSQERILSKAADTFKSNEQYTSGENKLMVVGHADVRGPQKYNLTLSERRAQLVKNYLVSQGIPADKIEVRAEGKDKELDQNQVAALQSRDAEKPPTWMNRKQATWLAYNRRVDIILEPTNQESTEAYPNDSTDAKLLWQRPVPSLKNVQSASQATSNQQAQLSQQGR